MKPLYRNIFFVLGIIAVVVMLLTFDMDYAQLWAHICKAGWWFLAVVGVWVVIYIFNALSWFYIIRNGERPAPVGFWKVFKLTITGFALNYATPCGLMGGEPYRIMELSPIIGSARATSSVILYVMMHIFSHICFWLASVFVYLFMYTPDLAMWFLLAGVAAFCLAAIYFFMQGYKNGMIVKTLRGLSRIPWLGKFAARLLDKNSDKLHEIDSQIAELHQCHRSTFLMSFAFEFTARVLTAMEIYFILRILTNDVNVFNCILIMAFTSLFGNIFFFSPMQLGAREGGFALSVGALAIDSAFGVYTGLITRVREIIWIIIGLALMKIGNSKSKSPSNAPTDANIKEKPAGNKSAEP